MVLSAPSGCSTGRCDLQRTVGEAAGFAGPVLASRHRETRKGTQADRPKPGYGLSGLLSENMESCWLGGRKWIQEKKSIGQNAR